METVLIIEDDSSMLRGLKDNFEYAGYDVVTASDGEAGLGCAVDVGPDLIVLDIMLPKINGYEICRLIRKEKLDMPIIMLTAKGQEDDIVLGLNLGANDYVTKPFSIRELLARAEGLLRVRRQENSKTLTFGQCTLTPETRQFTKDGKELKLSPREFDLLAYMLRNPNRVLTRGQILNAVWGYDSAVTDRTVDRFVTTVRKKVERQPRRPAHILTVREIGYRFLP